MQFVPDIISEALCIFLMIIMAVARGLYHYPHKVNFSASYVEQIISWDLNPYLSGFGPNYFLKCCANTTPFALHLEQAYAQTEQKVLHSQVPAISQSTGIWFPKVRSLLHYSPFGWSIWVTSHQCHDAQKKKSCAFYIITTGKGTAPQRKC